MTILIDPRNYAHVPVGYWPFLFLRLWALYWWTRHHDLDVVYDVTADGRIVVHFVSDDPRDLRAWMYRRQHRVPAHHYACGKDGGELHLPDFVILVTMMMEATGFMERWIAVRHIVRRAPDFADSS